MEILTQTTHWSNYILILIVAGICGLLTLSLFIGGIFHVIDNGVDAKDIILEVICLTLTVVLVFGFFNALSDGPETTYQAKITDFNAVYQHGYEVVNHDGSLYTIRKEEK